MIEIYIEICIRVSYYKTLFFTLQDLTGRFTKCLNISLLLYNPPANTLSAYIFDDWPLPVRIIKIIMHVVLFKFRSLKEISAKRMGNKVPITVIIISNINHHHQFPHFRFGRLFRRQSLASSFLKEIFLVKNNILYIMK